MTAAAHAARHETPYGAFQLNCYPARANERLVAWCSADTLLLEETHRRGILGSGILVVNDIYGALCVALEPHALWTDSALAVLALRHNERANRRTQTRIVWSTEVPPAAPELVVLRIPKQRPLFEYQLSQLARLLPEQTTVLAAGMDKHLSPHTAAILERYIGPAQRHRGQHKARLFSAIRDERSAPEYTGIATYHSEALSAELCGLANVFSREKLDMGTRLLLEQLHTLAPAETLIDLACGNGILGLVALKQGVASNIAFCDESAMAVRSASLNASRIFPQEARNVSFLQGDGLLEYRETPAQIILCNPPFHLQHTVDDFAGRHLLKQCSQHLQSGGRLYFVANRHLDYQPTLRRTFDRVEKFASNAQFNIVLAQKS